MNVHERAVAKLKQAGILAKVTDYGFRIYLPEDPDRLYADCGMDNDGSISMSVSVDETPPVAWFFRKDFEEMTDFVISAYAATNMQNPSRAVMISALRKLDRSYDDTELRKMTEAFLGKLENED